MLLVINLSSKWKTFETPKGDVEYECALQTSRSSINVTANTYRVPTMRSEGKAGQRQGDQLRQGPQSTKEKAGLGGTQGRPEMGDSSETGKEQTRREKLTQSVI